MGSKTNGNTAQYEGREILHDFLGLEGCTTLRKDLLEEHIWLIGALYEPEIPEVCPVCGDPSWSETQRQILFWDIPRGSNPVLVQLIAPLITCNTCGQAHEIMLSWLHETRQLTYRLERHILDRAATLSTFSQIAIDTGQDVSTVEDIFLEEFARFDKQRGKHLPRILLIDEVHFHGRYYVILVDGETGATVDLIKGRKASDVRQRLKQAPNADAVEYWCQDFTLYLHDVATTPKPRPSRRARHSDSEQVMDTLPFGPLPNADEASEEESYRLTKEELAALLPNAKPIGDHFHFKQAIIESLDKARVYVQNSLCQQYFQMGMGLSP